MINTPKILDSLNLLPKITNITIDSTKENFTSLNVNFEIDADFSDKKSIWFLDPKVLKLLNLTITYSLKEYITQNLLTKDKEFIFTGIPDGKYKSSDFIQIKRKFNDINSKFAKTFDLNGKVQASVSFQDLLKLDNTPEYLNIFIGVSIDKKEISNKFSINIDRIKTTGNFINEDFILNSKYISNKINDLTVFRQKDKFQFNSNSFLSLIENTLLLENKLQKSIKENSFSTLYHSINKDRQLSCLFFVKLESIFKYQSKFPSFFENIEFLNNFFKLEKNYLPEHVIVTRFDSRGKYQILYDGSFSQFISNDNFVFTRVDVDDSKILCLSFLDKTTSNFNSKYKYQIELKFDDRTVQFLKDIKDLTINEQKNIEQIINIAKYKNYYQISTNSFNDSLEKDLSKNNLSIKQCILNTSKILSQFKEFDEKTVSSIVNLASSKSFNFELLECLSEILGYIKSEIVKVENKISFSTQNKILTVKKFNEQIDFSKIDDNFLELFDINNFSSIANLTLEEFNNRIVKESNRFFNINDIVQPGKFTYFSPSSFYGKYNTVKQEDMLMDKIDYNVYNNLIIDYYYQYFYGGEFLNLSNVEKLDKIIQNSKLSFSNFFSDKINYESILLHVFLKCIVIKNDVKFTYKNIDSKDFKTKTSKLIIDNLPLGMRSLFDTLETNSVFCRVNEENLRKNIIDVEKSVALYMNYKNIYKIQFFDINDFTWKDFDQTIIINNKNFVCRYIPYSNEGNDIVQKEELQFYPLNDIFTITTNKNIEAIKKIDVWQVIPNRNDVVAIYPFGSRVYKNSSDVSDYDFIVLYNNIQSNSQIINDNKTLNITTQEQFKKDLEDHKPYALECYYLNDVDVIKQPNKKFNLNLNFDKLRKSFIEKINKEYENAFERISSGNIDSGKKSLFHGLRVAIFGNQIIKYGKIVNYSEANFIWENIKGSNKTDWNYFKLKYTPIINELKKEFLGQKDISDISEIYKMLN